MTKKVLVTYASRAGSTAEIAQTIAGELAMRGFMVDLRSVREAENVAQYDAVVVGSAIRMSQWMPEAMKFVEKNQVVLQQKDTAFFSVYLMNMGQDEVSRKARSIYMDGVKKLVSPKAEASFSGVGDMKKVGLLEGLIGRMVKSPEGDFRNWDEIRAWANQILAA